MGSLLGRNNRDTANEDRKFTMNNPTPRYGNNQIKSTSSTVLTFIPLNLLHQFSNIPNIYFLLICVLQMIPSISVTGGKPTTLIPLSFVLLTVLIKDAYEEFVRYRKDREENMRKTLVLGGGGFVEGDWECLEAGQVIKIKEDQIIPCDALVISSNLPDNKCFIETRSLDGETNLKVRKAPQINTPIHTLPPSQLYCKKYTIQCQAPTNSLNNIRGRILAQGETIAFSIENTLLRGCHLRNCKEVICVALYVGSDTKVILNSAKFSAKKSKLMSLIDQMVLKIFIAQIVLSIIFSCFNYIFESRYHQFMQIVGKSVFFFNAASWWLLMTYFVPISLIVTMEMIKLFQGSVIEKDRRGYSKEYQCFVGSNNTSINENLGQIKYVFTDKTGTLTKNEMNFKKIVVNGLKYGDQEDISDEQMKRQFPATSNVSFRDSNFLNNLRDQKLKDAVRILYLCHDIIINKSNKQGQKYSYNSSSPDQIALINFAKLCGYELMEEQGNFTRIYDKSTNSVQKYEKLAFLQFTSDRKRMSVIIRNPNGELEILMKGADSIVEKRLRAGQPTLGRTKQFLEQFSIQGLRTLMLAKKSISQNQFKQWYSNFNKAQSSIQDRQKNLAATYQIIERDMQLVGGTAVEDKLQDQVAETIVMMRRAGIKFFILTGDKKQTAVSIGRSCGLIEPEAKIFSYPQQKQAAAQYKNQKVYLIDASDDIRQMPADVLKNQTICYRCTPVQKKNIVKHVKDKVQSDSEDKYKPLTLAIGDGANDVNMILEADVGIGVKGKEGTQATRVADISVGEYKFLAFVVLYYGRQWYRKNARLVCYNFFKNWYHVAAVITFGLCSYFSAVVVFDIYNYELFNAIYAALPIVIYAVFDEEYDWQESKMYSDIYKPGLENAEFNTFVYFQNVVRGIIYGVVSILIVFLVLESDILTLGGRTGYMEQSGSVLFFNIILVCNLRVLIMSHRMSWGLIMSVVGSLVLYWLVYWLQTLLFEDFRLKDSIYEEWITFPIYFVHIILVFLLIATEYAYLKYMRLVDKQKRFLAFYAETKTVAELLGLNMKPNQMEGLNKYTPYISSKNQNQTQGSNNENSLLGGLLGNMQPQQQPQYNQQPQYQQPQYQQPQYQQYQQPQYQPQQGYNPSRAAQTRYIPSYENPNSQPQPQQPSKQNPPQTGIFKNFF